MKATVSWFEIPVLNFERAKKFYESILNQPISALDLGDIQMGLMPNNDGAIVLNKHYEPSKVGVLIYLDANPDLEVVQDRIIESGGEILQPKKMIAPEKGYMCLFLDTEGNRLALISSN